MQKINERRKFDTFEVDGSKRMIKNEIREAHCFRCQKFGGINEIYSQVKLHYVLLRFSIIKISPNLYNEWWHYNQITFKVRAVHEWSEPASASFRFLQFSWIKQINLLLSDANLIKHFRTQNNHNINMQNMKNSQALKKNIEKLRISQHPHLDYGEPNLRSLKRNR